MATAVVGLFERADQMDHREILQHALAITDESERSAFVHEACGDDTTLRKRIEQLVRSADELSSEVPNAPSVDATATMESRELPEHSGAVIGPYKLREQIGEGGMGTVYAAEQQRPIQRKVALKIIKPGMDTKEVVARFEAERQALALMNHPNIAKVFDAGTTESGRPYFVMELVQGIPLTEYCDRAKLQTKDRLSLFVAVAKAVQHAHQKGIIHRDLKPSNILATEHDSHPVVKVIDFGVAKAINQRLTEQTIYTQFQQMVGTPMYMSPEQAELSGLDVDTRTDIYSLGVVLYELVTGSPPFDRDRFQNAAYDDIRRIIREEEPSKPSTKVSTLRESSANVSAAHGTEPQKLAQVLRGDIDWIVMKALEKDRNRRYETASSFAVDVERYLSHQPIEARPPSGSYRALKFLRRNKGPASAVAAVALALLAGTCLATIGFLNAREQARVAEVANAELAKANTVLETQSQRIAQTVLHQAYATAMSGNLEQTKHYLELARTSGASEAQGEFIQGLMHWGNADNELAIAHLERAAELDKESVAIRAQLSFHYLVDGDVHKSSNTMSDAWALEATAPEDFLFLGGALSFDFEKSLKQIERGLELHDSPLSRAMHGNVLSEVALARGDRSVARNALLELAQAQVVLGRDNKYVLSSRLRALTSSIILGRDQGIGTAAEEAAARECVVELSKRSLNAIELVALATYYQHVTDDLPAADSAWRRAADTGTGDAWSAVYAGFLFDNEGPEEAIAELRRKPRRSSWSRAFELLLLAGQPDAELREIARSEWKEVAAIRRQARDWAILVPLLLGEVDSARAAASEWKEGESEWAQNKIDYLVDTHPDAAGFEASATHPFIHYVIAIKALGKGNREKAKLHLGKMYATPYVTHYVWQWSRGLLSQIDRDRDWPYSD